MKKTSIALKLSCGKYFKSFGVSEVKSVSFLAASTQFLNTTSKRYKLITQRLIEEGYSFTPVTVRVQYNRDACLKKIKSLSGESLTEFHTSVGAIVINESDAVFISSEGTMKISFDTAYHLITR